MSDARKAWMGYVRGFPSRLEQLYREQLQALSRSPETAAWFARHMPNASAAERTEQIQIAAAQRAQAIGGGEFKTEREKHGVKRWRKADLEAALSEEHAAWTPDPKIAAEDAERAARLYRERVVPEMVGGDMQRLQSYMPFDPDEVPPAQKPIAPKKPATSPDKIKSPDPAPPAVGDESDPVLAMLYRRMPGGPQNA